MAVVTLTETNFQQEVMNQQLPVLIDFWAPWCAPCRMMSPVVDELAEELGGKIKVGKINVDEESGLAAQYGVMSIPTILVIKDGGVVATSVGARPKEDLKQLLGL